MIDDKYIQNIEKAILNVKNTISENEKQLVIDSQESITDMMYYEDSLNNIEILYKLYRKLKLIEENYYIFEA